MPNKITLDLTADDLAALRLVLAASERGRDNTPGWHRLRRLADDIETQLPKAPVEEPTKFGSIVKARCESHSGLFWVRAGGGYWVSDHILGSGLYCATWNLLDVIEVLRVGVGEPTPEQVEAEAVCNCDYVARGGPGATPERPVEHHPLCDINLPADKRSGPRAEQVEADLAQDEQAHARYYAQAGVPVITRDVIARACKAYLAWPDGWGSVGESPMHAAMRAALEAALLPEEPTS